MSKHIIFIDTSVFESENFFKGRNLNHLADLSKSGQIELKITDIIYNEVINRIRENTLKAQVAFKKAFALINGEGKILKNLEELTIPKVDVDAITEELTQKFKTFLTENLVEIIDCQISNTKEVFKDYFEIKPPFHDGTKKSEFPDAFTYSTIKEWTKITGEKVYFLSNDSDFAELSTETIDCSHKLSTILDLIAREIDDRHTELIDEIYNDSKYEIISSLEKDYKNELADAVFNKLNHDPFYEDVDIETAEDITAEIIIGVINEINLNSSFSYEIESTIKFYINVEYTDLGSGFYDKEDGIWWGEQRVTETKYFSANVISIAEFEYDIDSNNGSYYIMSNFTIRDLEQ